MNRIHSGAPSRVRYLATVRRVMRKIAFEDAADSLKPNGFEMVTFEIIVRFI